MPVPASTNLNAFLSSPSPYHHIPAVPAPSSLSPSSSSSGSYHHTGAPMAAALPYPALYLYPLNDSFVPKHIALSHGQHVKIGRQTNAKTAPGERNGYFDSKVLSRQHAEVWEEGGRIFIKDVKSSNGTFINGERLSSEAVESEPYELKSDDIVEFGIDIVGEDNKTIIHHKVAARVICVHTEQDAQVAARAEQHQAQQSAQQHQSQYGSGVGGSAHQTPQGVSTMLPGQGVVNGIGGGQGAPSGFNFNGQAQRRPQMSQPSLGGLGGGMRPPGKTGLSFDVILSRLQGELQKSRETGAELSTLNGAMGEICDTLAGGLPTNIPPYPSILPPVRPSQEASTSPDPSASAPAPPQTSQSPPPPSTALNGAPTTVIGELQRQLQDTQSSLASQLEKIRALEAVLKEQEEVRREVRGLREVVEARARANDGGHERHVREPRGGFDLEEEDEEERERRRREMQEDEEEDDGDDARSVSTVMGHGLERVDEEEEPVDMDVDLDDHHSQASSDGSPSSSRILSHLDDTDNDKSMLTPEEREQQEEFERREQEAEDAAREDMERRESAARDEVGRPGTPEPVLPRDAMAKRAPSPLTQSMMSVRDNGTIATVLSPTYASVAARDAGKEAEKERDTEVIREQLKELSAQVSAVVALTTTLEAQHAMAQSTIKGLEGKVEALEGLLKQQLAHSVSKSEGVEEAAPRKVESEEKETLTDRITDWMKNVEGKWNTVQEEWNQERERLGRAREEWESKVRLVDSNLQRLANATASTSQGGQGYGAGGRVGGVYVGNGDVVKHNGLVTPPSPRSQSSDSGRYRRQRRRRSSGERRASEEEEESSADEEGREQENRSKSVERTTEPDTNGTEREGTDTDTAPTSAASSLGVVSGASLKEKGILTPDPSLYKASALSRVVGEQGVNADGQVKPTTAHERNMINLQTAAGVLLLSVAAAAVIWKVKPE